EVIRKERLEKIKILLDKEEKSLVENSYKLISKENLRDNEYSKYLKKYPALKDEEIYILDTSSKEDIDRLNTFLSRAISLVLGIEKGGEQELVPYFGDLPEGVDPFEILKSLPEEELHILKAKIDEQLEIMPESIITQSAINFIKDEYEAIGVDIPKGQSKYI